MLGALMILFRTSWRATIAAGASGRMRDVASPYCTSGPIITANLASSELGAGQWVRVDEWFRKKGLDYIRDDSWRTLGKDLSWTHSAGCAVRAAVFGRVSLVLPIGLAA